MKRDLLLRVPLFGKLDEADLDRLVAVTRTGSYEAGEDIVEVGDPGHSLFLILEGEVRVLYPARSTDFELARLGVGDFFGEMALLNDKPRSATVRAVGPVKVAALAKDDFRSILLESPGVALELLEALSVRIRNADEHLSGLSDKAVHDPLTGILNRRAFRDRISEECDRTRRYGEPFSLILIDLDHFKAVNDDFGHDTGDEVLSWVGRILKEHTRGADAPFRIGGEEFAVLCPSTDETVANHAARRLVELVGHAQPPVDFDLRITMSAGHATCPLDGQRPEELYRVADQALLKAKRGGRNRAVIPDRGTAAE